MGNAQVAVATGVTAGYWNPAGLAAPSYRNLAPELTLMHAAYFANIANYNYGAFTMPIDSAGTKRFGLTIIRMGVDNIPNTLSMRNPDGTFDFSKITSFSASDFSTMLSYAWRPKFGQNPYGGLSLGTNFKIVYRGVGRFANAWGFGMDFGARYESRNFSAGVNVSDITTTYTSWTFNTETFYREFVNTGNAIPQNSVEVTLPSVRAGVAYDARFGRRMSLLMTADGVVYFDGRRASSLVKVGGVSIDPAAGMELAYKNFDGKKIAFLRGGIYNIQNYDPTNKEFIEALSGENASSFEPQIKMFPTVGAGFSLKNTQVDYALSNIGNLSQNLHSHVVSLKFIVN